MTCYKTDSCRKLLIFNGLLKCIFSGHLGQPIDFSGFGAHSGAAINKVIHMISPRGVKLIQINDLSRTSEIHVSIGA